jgi:tetratricopeptide (TPR) repeat protein
MTVRHPDPSASAKFLQGELRQAENHQVLRSLLAAWRACREEWGEIWGGGEGFASLVGSWSAASQDYDRAFANLPAKLAERSGKVLQERERLGALLERFQSSTTQERKALVVADEDSRVWLFCDWLIESCHDLVYTDLTQAIERADSAISLAERLPEAVYGQALIHDLKARAWACVGETLRVSSDLRSSEEAFAIAESFILEGTGDALEEARILELKSALLGDWRRFTEAHQLLDEVIAIYRQYRDFHFVGRAFVQKGRIYGISQDLEPAIHWLKRGLGLLDSPRERRFELAARHSLMLYLHESGRYREARFLLTASSSEFQQHGGELLNLDLLWLDGKTQACLGSIGEAEKSLLEARQGFIRLGIGFSAATVSLDLAALYASQGRATEMRQLAEEMLPIFQSRDLHREAIAALITFSEPCRWRT